MSGRRATFLPLVAPAVLLVIAALQAVAVHTRALSPWKGGGFGMFSTVDAPSARFVRALLLHGTDSVVPVDPRLEHARLVRFARTTPTRHLAETLAEASARSEWAWTEGYSATDYYHVVRRETAILTGLDVPAQTPTPIFRRVAAGGRFRRGAGAGAPPLDLVPFDSVRLGLWRYRFDGKAGQLIATQIVEVTAPRAARALR